MIVAMRYWFCVLRLSFKQLYAFRYVLDIQVKGGTVQLSVQSLWVFVNNKHYVRWASSSQPV